MTYVYTGPSTLATIGIAVISAVVAAATIYGLWWLEGWWLERRDEEPGPIDPGVDGVEPAGVRSDVRMDRLLDAAAQPCRDCEAGEPHMCPGPVRHDDPPFPDGWHSDGSTPWAPSPADVELGRQLTRERFGGA
jgi:hypothetical protein